MKDQLRIRILGSGSSGGVPRADGDFGACDPQNPRNHRSRCSLLVERRGPNGSTLVLIDTSPDLRLQTAAAGISRLDAILFTHDHADQAHGLDDVRAFVQKQGFAIPTHMDPVTRENLTKRFSYIFEGGGGYTPICMAMPALRFGDKITITGPGGDLVFSTFEQTHGQIKSVGYRFYDIAYSPDVSALSDEAFSALASLKLWILDALRYRPHPTHAHVDLALAWISRVHPKDAVLTNLHIDLDYEKLANALPKSVIPAYDGLEFWYEI